MADSNPFTLRPIDAPALFFDREKSLSQLLSAVFDGAPKCRSVTGQRRIGKTSLALQLQLAIAEQQATLGGDHPYLVIYFDCQLQRPALRSYQHFYESLNDQLLAVAPPALATFIAAVRERQAGHEPDETWVKLLKLLWQQGAYVVVLFDEFERAISRKVLHEEDLFGSLRGHANQASCPNFGWITLTRRSLPDLFQDAFKEFGISPFMQELGSPFYNIELPHVVRLFNEFDAYNMVEVLAERGGMALDPETRDAIFSFGGHFPYCLQLAGMHFYEAQRAGHTGVREVMQTCREEVADLWQTFWNKLSAVQQGTLLAIAENEKVNTDRTVQELHNASLIYDDPMRGWQPFSEEFRRYVQPMHPNHFFSAKPGVLLARRYQVLDTIGMTAHSQVLKVFDVELHRVVAAKLIRLAGADADEQMRQSENLLAHEAVTMAQLRHPCIGEVYHLIRDPVAMIMEFVEGTPLSEVEINAGLAQTEVAEIGMHLAEALQHAHGKGVVHRDIKPSNIIRMPDGSVKLIDFNIARASGSETISLGRDGTALYLGTERYSAPEQLQRMVHGPEVDLFALGAVLHELLTGKRPYPLGNDPRLYPLGCLPPLEQAGIPPTLYIILARLLAEEPRERGSAAELREDLWSFLAAPAWPVGEMTGDRR